MSSRSKPKTGIAERLAVRLAAHDLELPLMAHRDGAEWHALSEADREEYRELARIALRFLAEADIPAGLGTLASRAAEVARSEVRVLVPLGRLSDEERERILEREGPEFRELVEKRIPAMARASRDSLAEFVLSALRGNEAGPAASRTTGPAGTASEG